jgi:KipI family sensor histidine kinase inhibitor
MPTRLIPRRIADDVIELQVSSPVEAQTLASALREAVPAEDVVAGLDRVSVQFHPSCAEQIEHALQDVTVENKTKPNSAPPIEIGISYGGEYGPDLASVCEALDLSTDAFIETHTQRVHTVEMIGFTPGFSYISGLPENFSVPRLASPRPRVPAGSVGVSAGFTGIYALNGPGGWPLIGTTNAELFRANNQDPFLLTPGQLVRFRAL